MTLDYLVIGAGPAGLQLAALLERDGADYLVLEQADVPGAFFTRFPRHRTLISTNKVHAGTADPELRLRFDWNSLLSPDPTLRFTEYTPSYFPSADVMVRYLADFAERTGARVRYRTRVTRVARTGDGFTVEAGGDVLAARCVVVATGVSEPYVPPIDGVELAERYDTVSVDPADFVDQRVLVIGKGNSAFETADNLLETTTSIHVAGPGSLHLAWRTHFVGHLRAVNNNFLDTYQLKSANAVLDGTVLGIERDGDGDGLRVAFHFSRADETKQLHYDRVILATGFRFDASVFDESARPRLTIRDRFPQQTSAFESVNVPGLFFAGTLTQQRDFKRSTNGFVHGFRYGTRALHRILAQRYDDRPWPTRALAPTPEALADAVVARVNRTSALWQQFGVLADALVVDDDGARYLEEVPVDHALDGGLALASGALALLVTLEYGPEHDQVDPFDVTVARIAQDTPGQAHDAAYLHPVVRVLRGTEVVAEHHLAENLENRWDRPDAHVAPLVAFLRGVLEAGPSPAADPVLADATR